MTTVKQLIEALKLWPDDMMVVVRGYECGYNDASLPHPITLALNVHDEWYFGAHDNWDNHDDREKVEAIKI